MRRGLRRAGVGAGLFTLLLLGVGSPHASLAVPGVPGDQARNAPPERTVLFRIAADDHETLARLAQSPAPPVSVRDGATLAWGPESALPLIRASGIQIERLTERLPDRGYAFVYTDGGGRAGQGVPLESLGRVLCRGPHTAVLEYPAGTEGAISESYVLVPVGDRSIELPPAMPFFRTPSSDETDPIIEWCVGQADSAELEARVQALQDFGTRRSESLQAQQAQQYIHGQFESFGLTDVTDFDYNSWCDDVVAVQRGAVASDEIYVIGGHYDSFAFGGLTAPGADDDASGTVGVLEAARILSQLDFEATIVYIAFSGEEQGLVGSRAWAAYARSQDLDIRGMLNLDMIGYVAPGDTADLDLILRSESSWLRDLVVQTAGIYLPDFPVVDGYLTHGDSDHTSFFENGYYSIFFFEDSNQSTPHIHTTLDVIDVSLNNFDFMRNNVQVAVATLATMARPMRVRITHSPIDDPPISADGYPLYARIQSTAPLSEDSVRVRYSVDRGEFVWIAMDRIEDQPEEWWVTIPKQHPGAYVQYAIRARDIEGRIGEAPLHGTYGFTVGLAAVFADSFDADKGWTVGAEGDSASTGVWVRAAPIGTEAQPATDAQGDSSGFCFVTGNGLPGGEPGDSDVDGGRTSLTSPRFDLAGAREVRIQYAYWYVDDTRSDDTLRVYLSIDDGASWKLVQSVGRSDPSWRTGTIAGMGLIPAPTDRMRLRFVAEDIGGSSLVEAAIDDVVIRAVILPPDTLRIRITHSLIEDPPISADGYPLHARIQSTAPLAQDSVRVRYAVDRGEFSWMAMSRVGDEPEEWGATIPKQAPGAYVQYAISARDIEGRVGEAPLRGTHAFTVGLIPVFADSFDAENGWTVGAPEDSATTGIWVRAAPVGTDAQPNTDAGGDSSGLCFVTGNGIPGGESGDADVDGGRTSLTSPRFDLAGARDVKVLYAYWYVDTWQDDTLRVYLSNDDGSTWELVQSIGRSERAWRSGAIQGMGMIPAPTDMMRLRFVAEDVAGVSLVEAAIDDVVVKAVIVPPDTRAYGRIVAAGPLPMQTGRGGLRILFDLEPGETASLALYDIQGRRIAVVGGVSSSVGRQEVAWDGRDDKGRSVAAGIYFLRLDLSGEAAGSLRVPIVR